MDVAVVVLKENFGGSVAEVFCEQDDLAVNQQCHSTEGNSNN